MYTKCSWRILKYNRISHFYVAFLEEELNVIWLVRKLMVSSPSTVYLSCVCLCGHFPRILSVTIIVIVCVYVSVVQWQ